MGEAAMVIETNTQCHEPLAQFGFREVRPVHEFTDVVREATVLLEFAITFGEVFAQFCLDKLDHGRGNIFMFSQARSFTFTHHLSNINNPNPHEGKEY